VIAPDDLTGPGWNLAGADVGDAIDRGQAVGAISGQAQATTAGGMQPGPEHGQQGSVTGRKLNRPVIYDNPHCFVIGHLFASLVRFAAIIRAWEGLGNLGDTRALFLTRQGWPENLRSVGGCTLFGRS
jgi:hypothetical protein